MNERWCSVADNVNLTNAMPTLKQIIASFSPVLLKDIVRAKRVLAPVSHQPWFDACSPGKRAAIDKSRFSILPPTFKTSAGFVIDVGANHGQWIGSLLEILRIGEVWVFEPNPEAIKICQQRLASRTGVKYFPVALGERQAKMALHVPASSNFASVLQPREEFLAAHYGKSATSAIADFQVEVCTLDSLVPESKVVDLLKIDVQGFERAVLSGARRVLRNTRAVLIEANLQSHYVGDDDFPALWTVLNTNGFSFWSVSPPYLGQGGKALWADAVFVKEKGQVSSPAKPETTAESVLRPAL